MLEEMHRLFKAQFWSSSISFFSVKISGKKKSVLIRLLSDTK